MKKRIFAAMAAALMTATVMSACGGDSSTSSSSGSTGDSTTSASDSGSETAGDEGDATAATDAAAEAIANRTETQHLVVSWMTWSGSPTDLQMVVDEMNALTVPELNIEIEMQVTDYASRNQTLTLQLTGGEQIDIMSCLGMTFSSAVQNDYLIDLEENDLIQTYGQDIIETMGQEFVDTCRIGGVLYGTPNQRDMAQGKSALCIRTDILVDACEAAGITPDLENETWYTDEDTVWEILKAAKDTHPEVTAFRPGTSIWHKADDLGGNRFGVLENWGQTTEVTNCFESEGYYEYCRKMHELYEYGCISADAVTDTTADMVCVSSGTAASYLTVVKPGSKTQETKGVGMDMTIIQTGPDFLYSTSCNGMPWTITYNTVDEVAAMQYLNFMYASPEWNDLFCWGVEGTHYVVTEDGHYTYPEGIDANSSGYNTALSWIAPAQFKAGVWEGDSLDLWERIDAFNKGAEVSMGNGFIFDTTPVSAQFTAVTNVYTEYQKSIEYGILDPDVAIPEMNEKMMTAGLQDIIDEKQKQFDEFLAAQG